MNFIVDDPVCDGLMMFIVKYLIYLISVENANAVVRKIHEWWFQTPKKLPQNQPHFQTTFCVL